MPEGGYKPRKNSWMYLLSGVWRFSGLEHVARSPPKWKTPHCPCITFHNAMHSARWLFPIFKATHPPFQCATLTHLQITGRLPVCGEVRAGESSPSREATVQTALLHGLCQPNRSSGAKTNPTWRLSWRITDLSRVWEHSHIVKKQKQKQKPLFESSSWIAAELSVRCWMSLWSELTSVSWVVRLRVPRSVYP